MSKKKKKQKLSQKLKERWVPTDNTRPQVFVDKKKKKNKEACRKDYDE